ncbi:carbamoyltransferase family protein [Paucibacter sp. XJ19-41]|uniref:carbamoyltransferase family protein n=1 Tax=Paucibacter sp. XJ19-41 TaxID=2927824 RepID=UPI00234B47E6|nr:carbamoyltransferase C-terminal domain-containing protein [Paucibacter sp. XJ19-41]MDC6167146.1 carbamoyltransferase C-terminal domain-containing protein [Paucibacter sp. XJ19-41]
MNVIGISGLTHAVPFQRRAQPGLDEREYRLTQGHDSAAVLVRDGEVVAAAAQERFCGVTHTGEFPADAIRYCLKEGGIDIHDVDEVVHGFDYTRLEQLLSIGEHGAQFYREVLSRDAQLDAVKKAFPGFDSRRFVQMDHHLSHAASVYYTSGWSDCLVMVIDAQGEAVSASAYEGRDGRLRELGHVSASDSVGILYSLVTFHLGFDFNADEYKIMGLAPYGDPERFKGFFERELRLLDDGGIDIPMLKLNKTPEERMRYLGSRAYLAEHLLPARLPAGEVGQVHSDVAAALQQRLEQAVFHLCRYYQALTGHRRLAYAGGVALNCSASGALRRSGLFDEVHVGPASGDDGCAMGAALHRASLCRPLAVRRLSTPYRGPSSSAQDIENALAQFGDRIEVQRFDSLAQTCAAASACIAAGEVISWFRGRMEFGARALGNRSILADPRHPDMRERINRAVKKREAFRPFAPAVLREEAATWFELEPQAELPYMTMVARVREPWRAHFPAITHVDGTARVQTVEGSGNAAFHALLLAVRERTGCGMVLNTSFNVKGQPIVPTASEAIATFLNTGIDALFIEDFLVTRGRAEGTQA